MIFTIPYNIWTNKRYAILSDQHKGFAPPESRLPLCMTGAIAAPISLFWFAWTNSPSIHWSVSIIAGAPFGFGLVLIFQGINNYLVDSYTIFSASVLAGTAVVRSVLATVFPLFTGTMYHNLGIHWASSIPAFLALVFAPFPFLLYKYGPAIRARCKYSAEALEAMKQLQGQTQQEQPREDVNRDVVDTASEMKRDHRQTGLKDDTQIEADRTSVEDIVQPDTRRKD